MNLATEDNHLLKDLCREHNVSFEKIIKLLDTVQSYEFKDRRTGVYDALREILKSGQTQKREA